MEQKEGTEKWETSFDKKWDTEALGGQDYGCDGADECCGCCGGWKADSEKIKSFIYQTLETERLRIEKEVEKKKLPIPNQYGTAVNLNRFNEVIDEILSIIRPKI